MKKKEKDPKKIKPIEPVVKTSGEDGDSPDHRPKDPPKK